MGVQCFSEQIKIRCLHCSAMNKTNQNMMGILLILYKLKVMGGIIGYGTVGRIVWCYSSSSFHLLE